ncbi:MAG: hypothetical protein K9G61_10290 [Bacteroidales bacterium]|jgi:hypothetical protein|nr:hypothetical protein [Bacteroidales bacterium]
MKNQIRLVVLGMVSVMLFFASCIPDDNSDLNPVDKFLGTWSVSDNAVRLNYQVTISSNPLNSAEVLMSNFADLGKSAVGLVVGNTIVVEGQTLVGNYLVSGTGSYVSDSRLNFNYELNDGIDVETRQATFSR